jgi:hypothetical protein
MHKLVYLKQKDISDIRDTIIEEQCGCCWLCGELLDDKTGVCLDHQHMTKKEELGVNGAGLVRGVLCRGCNSMEGKVWNNMKRYGIKNKSEWLRKLANYWDKDNYNMVHPNEIPRSPKLKKQSYNKLKKVYDKKSKIPDYPKSGKLTKKLSGLFVLYSIEPDYYTN